jgi:hypothetical protein
LPVLPLRLGGLEVAAKGAIDLFSFGKGIDSINNRTYVRLRMNSFIGFIQFTHHPARGELAAPALGPVRLQLRQPRALLMDTIVMRTWGCTPSGPLP